MRRTAYQAVVKGTGSALPCRIVTNVELESKIDTTDEWIFQRTGIRERRVSLPEETTSEFAVLAGRQALERAGVSREEVDLLVVATISGDYTWPSTSSLVQHALELPNAGAFDVAAACAGFVYATSVASAMLESGQFKCALVIGADCLTKQLDWTDRSTCILFGDGAAAIVLKAETGTDRGVLETVLLSDGSGAKHLGIEGGGTRHPYGTGKRETISMAGQEVYRFAVNALGDACEKVLEKAGYRAEDVDLFVPHQANIRIIDSAAKQLKLPREKVFVNLERYGNTSGASIPLAMDEAVCAGVLREGMLVLSVGFGAGLVWGANLIRW